MTDTFKHRHIYTNPGPLPVCADCGATAEPHWLEVTDFNDEPGVHRFVAAINKWNVKCPNGPHTFNTDEAPTPRPPPPDPGRFSEPASPRTLRKWKEREERRRRD